MDQPNVSERPPLGKLQLRAEVIEGDRCLSLSAEDAVAEILKGERTVWLDVHAGNPIAAARLLKDELGFHELAVEDALSDQERPALQEYGETLFLAITAPIWEEGRLRTQELGIFLLPQAIVTVHTDPMDWLDGWFFRWREHPGRIGSHPAYILYVLLDTVVDAYFPILDTLEDQADDLTDEIFGGNSEHLPSILRLKRNLLTMRKAISPMRDVLNSLLRRDLVRIPVEARVYFQDVYDHILRMGELVDTNREAMTGLLDIHLSTVSHSLNTVLKKMTVLSTVLMSMALIAGVYGMNFRVMPELQWTYGYPFALSLMLGSSGLILYVFRRVGWL